VTGSDWFVKVFWPIFASVVAAVFTFLSWRLNQRQQRFDSLNKAIESATSEGSQIRRIAGIWQMNQYWKEERFEETMAATLTAALIGTKDNAGAKDSDGLYRCAAAEVIGNAIDGPESYSTGLDAARSERIAHLLYGDRSGRLGLVSELNRELRGSELQQGSKTCENFTDISALDATREAIRKNWEYLRGVNLDTTDLTGIPLYSADLDSALLRGANLPSANLRCANLNAADLTMADLKAADFYLANVANLKPDESRSDLAQSKKAKEFKPREWELWRQNDFRVSKQGQPVLSSDRNQADDIFPCR
jgi:hypothetical protein